MGNGKSSSLDFLVQDEFLHEIDQDGTSAFIPSRPLEQVEASQIIRMILGKEGEADSVGAKLADQVVQSAEESLPGGDFPEKYLTKSLTLQTSKA